MKISRGYAGIGFDYDCICRCGRTVTATYDLVEENTPEEKKESLDARV